jgi:hypothetical protein
VFTVCAGLLLVIAAALILLHAHDQHHHVNHRAPVAVSRPVVLAPSRATTTPVAPVTTTTSAASKHKKRSSTTRKRVAAQDPQDHPGTAAAKRAARALASHRALQHVPYRHGDVTIRLTGALKNGKAILTVTAPTLAEAKAGYRRFLARYHDAGRAYQPRYVASRNADRRG